MLDAYCRWTLIENPGAWVRRASEGIFLRSSVRLDKEPEYARRAGLPGDGTVLDPDLAIFDEEVRRVIGLLNELPPEQRRVMAWRTDGYEPHEIASLIGKPVETVRSNLRHARARLARELTGAGRLDKTVTKGG